jgi:excisionase family DNA binding protein
MYSTDFREAVSVIEAARLIGVCRSRLYELLKDGDLKSIKLGKRRLVVRRSISELIRKLELIQASYDILEEIEPATVRAVCYRLFTAGIIPDMSERSTGKVSRQLTWARENDELPWEWIVDETRTPERVSSWADPKSYIRAVKRSYRKDLWRDQDNKVEVWSEKGTVRGTLGPILEEYGVTFRVQHGFASATSLHDAAEDSMDESFTVLYVGDHDPSGMYMSEIDIPDRLERYEAQITIERVALITLDTVSLPHFDLSSK